MPTIRELRKAKGLSQTELAVKAKLSTGTISAMERGHPVNASTLTLVCQVLGVSPDEVTDVNIVDRVNRMRGVYAAK